MKKHGLAATMEARVHSNKRALFWACTLVLVLVFYAVYLFWEDAIVDSAVPAHTDEQATLPANHSQRPAAAIETGQFNSSDNHRDTTSPAADQQVAVNFLLQQLQTSTQGVSVVGVSQQGLSGHLGLRDGDQITEINGQAVRTVDEVQSLLYDYHPKQILHFKGKRDGQVMNWTYQAQADD